MKIAKKSKKIYLLFKFTKKKVIITFSNRKKL